MDQFFKQIDLSNNERIRFAKIKCNGLPKWDWEPLPFGQAALTYREEITEKLKVEYLPVLSNEIYSQSHQADFLDKRNSQRQGNK